MVLVLVVVEGGGAVHAAREGGGKAEGERRGESGDAAVGREAGYGGGWWDMQEGGLLWEGLGGGRVGGREGGRDRDERADTNREIGGSGREIEGCVDA